MTDRRLHIGQTPDGDEFTLPADIAVQASAVIGKRGTGKTVTATVIVEELMKLGVHVVIIDPVDVWWGLKSSLEGDEEGFPVLSLGGSHGDLPLEADHGRRLADFAVEERVPMILSLRHLRKGEQRQFVTDFAEQLYHRKGEPENRVPLHLVVDEASRFIPQRVSGNLARSVGAFEDIVRQGRADGFGVTLIDQRPASVNKNVLSQADTLVAHQVTSPHDRKALTDWVSQHDEEGRKEAFLDRLASLELGQAWFWDPGIDVFDLVQVRMRETFDSSATPDLGEDVVLPEKVAEVDIDALRSSLEETLEEEDLRTADELREALEEARSERDELADEVDALESRVSGLRDQVEAGADEADVEHLRAELEEEYEEKIARAAHDAAWGVHYRWQDYAEEMEEALRVANGTLSEIAHLLQEDADLREAPERPESPDGDLADVEAEGRRAAGGDPHPGVRRPEDREELSGPERRVLDALQRYRELGKSSVERPALAAMAGYKVSGHFNNVVSDLRSRGLAEYPAGGEVALTEDGSRLARSTDVETLQDVHDLWLDLCSDPERKVLRELIDVHPRGLSREELADRTGYSVSGHFNNVVSSLKTWGAATYPEAGHVRASDLLFPEHMGGRT